MNKKQKINLIRIIVSAALLLILHFLPIHGVLRFISYLVPYFIIGYDVLLKAYKGIKNKQPFDESLLMAIATIGAIALALYEDGDYVEAIAVMLFYQVGEWFQSYAVGKSRKNIAELMDICPDVAFIEGENGEKEEVDPDDVEIGSIIIVSPGEKIPLDGVVVEGNSSLDTAALTGESLPRDVKENDEVVSGCININGVLKIKTTKEFGESTASKVLEMIEDASSRKSKSEDFITKFARVYTPIVVYSAIALAIIPPTILLILGQGMTYPTWIYRALTFLIISCPCALVVSIPLSFFAGIGAASRAGVLVKGSSFLEILSKTETIVFDKTGTLTKGVFDVTDIHPDLISKEELLHLAAHVERFSSHPIAVSLKNAFGNEADGCTVSDVEEISGRGVTAIVNGKKVYVGNTKLMDDIGAKWSECKGDFGTIVHVAIDGIYAGHILVSDVIKDSSIGLVKELKKYGIKKTVMLTGDKENVASKVAKTIGIDEYHSELLPQDKVSRVEQILSERTDSTRVVAFVGDGINDAPVLSRADIGIAMGAMGSDAAIEAADVVLMDDDPKKIVTAIRGSRKCLRIVYENIYFAIGIKILFLILGAFGIANMWGAVFADVGVAVLCILNAIRCLLWK
ncbi:MAG: cadmium-translocating P-type ATPase [Lachnospiraceae bacterium]|nr:cadmium-translocating P-type ATPase [Lachnospiraceae bacterium]